MIVCWTFLCDISTLCSQLSNVELFDPFTRACSAPLTGNSTLLDASKCFEPLQNRTGFLPWNRSVTRNGFYPGDGLAFHIEVQSGVLVGRVQTRVTEPLANRGRIHTGLQKGHSRAVAQAVGV